MTRRSLRLEDWPINLRKAWVQGQTPGDFTDEPGGIAHWATSSRGVTAYELGLYLAFQPDDERKILPIEELFAKARIDAWLIQLGKTRSIGGQASGLSKILMTCKALFPDQDWLHLNNRVRYLERNKRTARKAGRVVSANQLLELGLELMETATQNDSETAHIDYRDGLIIALLISRPMRRRNLAMIRLDEHLIQRDHHWQLVFNETDTKNGRPLEMSWPPHLEQQLQLYLKTYRYRFRKARSHNGLWAGCKGRPLGPDAIYTRICNRTKVHFGYTINPHLFRDCAATTLVVDQPTHAMAAKQLLGHARLDTTERHYLHAETLEAARQYQQLLQEQHTDA